MPRSVKRKLFSENEVSKRLKRVERLQRERKPEMKYKDYALTNATFNTGSIIFSDLTAIGEGDSRDDRTGRLIKFHRVEFRGGPKSGSGVGTGFDVYLTTSRNATLPVYGDYGGRLGGFATADDMHVWEYHLTGSNQDPNLHFAYSWKYPMKIHYEGAGTTQCVRNRTFLVIKNDVGATADFAGSIRIWYTDV